MPTNPTPRMHIWESTISSTPVVPVEPAPMSKAELADYLDCPVPIRDLWNRLIELEQHVGTHDLEEFEPCEICREGGEYDTVKRQYESAAIEYVDRLMQGPKCKYCNDTGKFSAWSAKLGDHIETCTCAAALTPVPVVAAPKCERENCPTSRRTGQGDCGEMFTVHGVTHSCKYLADHEGSHWCNCKVATTPSPVSTDVPVAQPPRVEYEAMRQIFNALADTEASGAAEQLAHVEEIVTKYFRCATHTPVSREPLPCHICGTALDPNWLNCPKCEGPARSESIGAEQWLSKRYDRYGNPLALTGDIQVSAQELIRMLEEYANER